MEFENYIEQKRIWPQAGRHILAQYDDETIIVYQAFRPAIAEYALKHQKFGGEYSFTRMSWIKPNFLWMMYRSGWGTKSGQEYILALKVKKIFFDNILLEAGWSSFTSDRYKDYDEWKSHVQNTQVRLQWDPDHKPDGDKEERKAIQLGLKDEMLARLNDEGLVGITNMNSFVELQRPIASSAFWDTLVMPKERVYTPSAQAAKNILVSHFDSTTDN